MGIVPFDAKLRVDEFSVFHGWASPEQNATFDKSMLQMTMSDVGDAFSNDHHFWFVKFRSVPSLKLGHPSAGIFLGPGLSAACFYRGCRYYVSTKMTMEKQTMNEDVNKHGNGKPTV